MIQARFALAALGLCCTHVKAQALADSEFRLALSAHPGQLSWSATGFKVIQTSAKPDGHEIGLRARSASGDLTFLGFLFLFPEQAPLTSSKCREQVIGPALKANPRLRILKTAETSPAKGLPISSVSSSAPGQGGATVYSVRAFIATGDICGDLEVYGKKPISLDDPEVKEVFSTYQFDEKYEPRFKDVVFYGEVLYRAQMYTAAAPILESALGKLKDDGSGELPAKTWKRVVTDEAGMAYGMSGNVAKARVIFERAIAEDPEYPLYYYNLACADAEEKRLTDARTHLRQAFARRANLISSETMPDPTKDDSFLPYRKDKTFWAFLEALQAGK